MSNEDYPIHDVYLNMKTVCTIDEAIAMLLNLMPLPKEFIQMSDEEIYKESLNDEYANDWTLQDTLTSLREDLVSEYIEAKNEKMPVDSQLQAIKDFDNNYIKKARAYLLDITDEIAKGTIRVNNCNNITLKSLYEWATSQQIIFETDTVGFTSHTKTIPQKERGLSQTKTKNFYLTFVCLLNAFIEKTSGKQFGSVGNLNITALASYLASKSGQSEESIKSRIEEALAEFEKNYSKTR